ncbi:MAG: hypothetical protein IPL55_10360 [Saprospiraceae bacterium]|jgi:hypothetical protein|nr:hypothetical protein [Saprospiraceae bacterium]
MNFKYWDVTILLTGLMVFFSCKNQHSVSSALSGDLLQMEVSITNAEKIKHLLLLRADSLKVINEFEAIKIYNNLNILDENVASLKLYRDTIIGITQETDAKHNLIVVATTQAEYVNSLIASGQAMLDNRSLSFGNWKEGTPKAIHDSIMTPVKK